MDSDEDGDSERVISLTHLLFGNIDSDGQLENDFLDPQSIRHLHQLRQLGIATILKEITDDVDSPDLDQKDYNGNDECTVKSPSAVDYSDITELADEIEEVDASSTPFLESVVKEQEKSDIKLFHTQEVNDVKLKRSDADLMPPPPPPKDEIPCNGSDWNGNINASLEPNNKEQVEDSNAAKSTKVEPVEKKLDTPLAAMLPSKYKNMDVTKLFPEFRHGQVLRFSRLFGPGKPTSLPQIWRGVKKKKKKKKSDESVNGNDIYRKTKKLTIDIPLSPPPPEECESDDEVKLLKPEEKNRLGTKNESYKTNELSPGFAAWRYGPSQLWYDMLNVPESGEGFDYGGFRLKESCELDDSDLKSDAILDNEYPDDAFFMVTQNAWEDEVIWNGEEVKNKVLAKLNNRNTMAAGWVPSSHNRTASAFSEQGDPLLFNKECSAEIHRKFLRI